MHNCSKIYQLNFGAIIVFNYLIMKALSIGFLLFLLTFATFSQFVNPNTGLSFEASSLDNPAYAGVLGSAYMPLAFTKAAITRTTGEIDTLLIRLDTYADYVEVQRNGKVYICKNQYKQLSVEIDDVKSLFRNDFKTPNWPNLNSFYQVLYDGKTKLLKHTQTILVDCYEYGGGTQKQCFRKVERYYIQEANSDLIQIDKDREQIWSILKNNSTLKEYATQHKLKLKNWSSVVKILQYYDANVAINE